jgi:uncharacterized protein (DUF983 family)
MYHNLHAPIFQELHGPYADVFEICDAGGDDVDYAEDALLVGVRVIVVVMSMVVSMVVGVIVRMRMIVGMRVIVAVRVRM